MPYSIWSRRPSIDKTEGFRGGIITKPGELGFFEIGGRREFFHDVDWDNAVSQSKDFLKYTNHL